ncbi:MAG: PQQ-binding-like beta-propeller repeat protein [Gemmatimonadales bacterium]|nr:PQQ-binding-like beta-propeller repeat protein [Gemmatimonadales bacterium]
MGVFLLIGCGHEGPNPEVAWTVTTFRPPPWQWGCSMAPPVVRDGVAYFGRVAGAPGHSHLYAVRASNGEVLWQRYFDPPLYGGIFVAPTRLLVEADDTLFALDRRDGRVIWRQPELGPIHVEEEGVVYATGRGNSVVALEGATGALRWRVAFGTPVDGLTPHRGMLYVTTGGTLLAVAAETGAIDGETVPVREVIMATSTDSSLLVTVHPKEPTTLQWHGQTGHLDSLGGRLIGVQPDAWIFSRGSETFALHPGGRGLLWSTAALPTARFGGGVFAGGLMFQADYITGKVRIVRAYDQHTGAVRWVLRTGGMVYAPVLSGDYVLVASEDCRVVAVPTGAPR